MVAGDRNLTLLIEEPRRHVLRRRECASEGAEATLVVDDISLALITEAGQGESAKIGSETLPELHSLGKRQRKRCENADRHNDSAFDEGQTFLTAAIYANGP